MTVHGRLAKRKGPAKLQGATTKKGPTRHDLRQFRYWRSLRGNPAKRLKFPVLAYPKRAPVDAAADGLG
jgi:hypothetical protein